MNKEHALLKFLGTIKYGEKLSKMTNKELINEIFKHVYGDLKMGKKECIISEIIERLGGVENE